MRSRVRDALHQYVWSEFKVAKQKAQGDGAKRHLGSTGMTMDMDVE